MEKNPADSFWLESRETSKKWYRTSLYPKVPEIPDFRTKVIKNRPKYIPKYELFINDFFCYHRPFRRQIGFYDFCLNFVCFPTWQLYLTPKISSKGTKQTVLTCWFILYFISNSKKSLLVGQNDLFVGFWPFWSQFQTWISKYFALNELWEASDIHHFVSLEHIFWRVEL